MKTTTDKARALCYAIEAAGASEKLNVCGVLASALLADLDALAKRDAEIAHQLQWHGEHHFPAKTGEVKHEARAVMESLALELATGGFCKVVV